MDGKGLSSPISGLRGSSTDTETQTAAHPAARTRPYLATHWSILCGPSNSSRLIVLDEPFTGLDAGSARLVKSVLRKRVQAGCAVIMTTHILEVVERMADRIGAGERTVSS